MMSELKYCLHQCTLIFFQFQLHFSKCPHSLQRSLQTIATISLSNSLQLLISQAVECLSGIQRRHRAFACCIAVLQQYSCLPSGLQNRLLHAKLIMATSILPFDLPHLFHNNNFQVLFSHMKTCLFTSTCFVGNEDGAKTKMGAIGKVITSVWSRE